MNIETAELVVNFLKTDTQISDLQSISDALSLSCEEIIEYYRLFEVVQDATIGDPIITRVLDIEEAVNNTCVAINIATAKLRDEANVSLDKVSLSNLGTLKKFHDDLISYTKEYTRIKEKASSETSLDTLYKTITSVLNKEDFCVAKKIRDSLKKALKEMSTTSNFFPSIS